MTIEYEPSRSYVYRATRYELLPRIVAMAREFADSPFRLLELSRQVLEETYTPEQLDLQIKKAESDKVEKMRSIFVYYISFLAKQLHIFESLGGGMFKNVSDAEEVEEVEEAEAEGEAETEGADGTGFIYAYSFPSIERRNEKFPIKIGLTRGDDADVRVKLQCRQTCCFEYPKVLQTWRVLRVAEMEHAIHSTLRARGLKRDAPGAEWFNTTVAEVDTIIKFIQPAIA
jgi:hypothetical protein